MNARSVNLTNIMLNMIAFGWWAAVLLIAPGYFHANPAYELLDRHVSSSLLAALLVGIIALDLFAIIRGQWILRLVVQTAASIFWTSIALSVYLTIHNSPGVGIYLGAAASNLVAAWVSGRNSG